MYGRKTRKGSENERFVTAGDSTKIQIRADELETVLLDRMTKTLDKIDKIGNAGQVPGRREFCSS